nr:MAG TPA: hypothetical protein [Caudoviricetes sp.]
MNFWNAWGRPEKTSPLKIYSDIKRLVLLS